MAFGTPRPVIKTAQERTVIIVNVEAMIGLKDARFLCVSVCSIYRGAETIKCVIFWLEPNGCLTFTWFFYVWTCFDNVTSFSSYRRAQTPVGGFLLVLTVETDTNRKSSSRQRKGFYFLKSTGIFISSKQWNHLILVLFHITKWVMKRIFKPHKWYIILE